MRRFIALIHAGILLCCPSLGVAGEFDSQNVEPLVAVENAPPIQMLVPGFQVDELPVELTNVNNLRYRPDGKLYALGYNGNITLLSDQDGDGREETATRFFENKLSLRGPIGMAVIPPNHRLLSESVRDGITVGQGVIVASKGKVSAILDLDGDDVAETERVIASGWVEIPQNVDAVGVAIDPVDGGIYFGLGTAAYNNAYLLDAEGVSKFDLASERGTIQRIAPDLSERTTICTGVRFPIGMEFDNHRELFISDQEGATWLPNGNPFDELLHIQPGKHFGFPPRHPRHLPNVVDQPSVFDYGPQHQSTCGMIFNRPFRPDGPIFGPQSWRNDLLVTGESRGKLYRTRLMKDGKGAYVASNVLIGCLKLLTVDCCVSPRGDLLVACHSGGPDWGTGPLGKGHIFRIRYVDREAPQVEGVWATGAQEVRITFDRPLDPEQLKGLVEQTSITYGQYVAAADRFETIRPGYAVVKHQQLSPRKRLPVYSASLTSDRKSLILATAIHPSATNYAIRLPGIGRPPRVEGSNDPFAQFPEVDLAYSLHGVVGTWESSQPKVPVVHRWLPHVDSEIIAKSLPSEAAEEFREMMQRPGTFTLEGQIDPRGWIFPAVQPGSQLDYPPDQDQWITSLSVWIQCEQPMALTVSGKGPSESVGVANGEQEVRIPIPLHGNELVPFRLRLDRGAGDPKLKIGWRAECADGSLHEGPVPLHRLVVPWTSLEPSQSPSTAERTIEELAGGSWGRGRQIFYSDEGACGKCHVAHGQGGNIGPDLSNLIHRDYASVYRDVVHPSFAINPDYVTYTGLTVDGKALTGVVRSAGDKVQFGDKDGRVTEIPRAELQSLLPASVSVMPEGIPERLGPERMKDLLTFLLQSPPRMMGKVHADRQVPTPADLREVGLPRSRAEVLPLLGDSKTSAGDAPPLNILLVAGSKDHGPGEHDYPQWLKVWRELLSGAPQVAVDSAMEWPTPDQFAAAQTIVFYQKGKWSMERARDIDAHLARGGGLVYVHWAVEGGAEAEAFANRIGLASNARQTKYRHGPLEMTFIGDRHPITRGIETGRFYDESYWALVGNPHGELDQRFQVLGTAVEAGEPRPLIWTVEPGRGRVFVSILGHYSSTFDDPLFRVLLLRGICWSANQPIDRLNDVVLLGANIEE